MMPVLLPSTLQHLKGHPVRAEQHPHRASIHQEDVCRDGHLPAEALQD